MDVSPVEESQRNKHEGWDWNGSSLPYSTRFAAALRHGSIPPQSNATPNSVAGGGAHNDRLLVLKDRMCSMLYFKGGQMSGFGGAKKRLGA
jgi:hypothetical protein